MLRNIFVILLGWFIFSQNFLATSASVSTTVDDLLARRGVSLSTLFIDHLSYEVELDDLLKKLLDSPNPERALIFLEGIMSCHSSLDRTLRENYADILSQLHLKAEEKNRDEEDSCKNGHVVTHAEDQSA